MAKTANLRIDQGATWRGIGTVLQADGKTPIDLTNAQSGRMQIRQRLGAQAVVDEFNTTNGGLTLGVGTITIFITAAQTAALLPIGATATETFVYDIAVLLDNGDTIYPYRGSVLVYPSVTQ